MHAKKIYVLFVVTCTIILAIAYIFFFDHSSTIDKATTLSRNLTINSGDSLVVKNGSPININGALTVKGTLRCDNGPLIIEVQGKLTVDGDIICDTTDLSAPSIQIVAHNDVTFGQQSHIKSAGSMILTDNKSTVPADSSTMLKLFSRVLSSEGQSEYGPFLEQQKTNIQTHISEDTDTSKTLDGQSIIISGVWKIATQNTKDQTTPLLFINFAPQSNLLFSQYSLSSVDGINGENVSGGCRIFGTDGLPALRLLVVGGLINIDATTINFPNGGDGGNAKTNIDCPNAYAKGGNGGNHGNMRFHAATQIIFSQLNLFPGRGGGGGNAEAYGKEGAGACPGENGGNATAIGGNADNNFFTANISGNISGVGNIKLHRIDSANGGNARALSGRGGNGTDCKCLGGSGGIAHAEGGKGGDAIRNNTSATGEAHAGNGGAIEALAGGGGTGGSCELSPSGGDGGTGGKSEGILGIKGNGTTADGNDGEIINIFGGIGGDGGDGCPNGNPGAGGTGSPSGANGNPGRNNCAN